MPGSKRESNKNSELLGHPLYSLNGHDRQGQNPGVRNLISISHWSDKGDGVFGQASAVSQLHNNEAKLEVEQPGVEPA